jgi:hypothetical protein
MTIKILVVHEEDGQQYELAAIKIDRLSPTFDEATWADYQVTMQYHDIEESFARRRTLQDFPRKHLNIMGLIKHAINLLKPEEITLHGDLPGHMAGRQHRALPEIPPWAD